MQARRSSYVRFCSKPWEELVVYPNGDFSICCGGPPVGRIENVNQIKNIWNSGIILKYRNNLNHNIEDGICKECIFHGTLRNTGAIEHQRQQRPIHMDGIPVISFGLTDQCNLSCFMCGVGSKYAGVNRKRHADRLPLAFCEAFAVHHFTKAEVVNTNCFGELFLFPKLLKFLDLVSRNTPRQYATCTSSGSLRVGQALWRRVLKAHQRFIFSVDSLDEDIHRVIRGFDLKRLRDNVAILKNLKETEFPQFKYGFSSVLMKLTIGGLYDTLREAHEEYGCQLFHFQHVCGQPEQSLAHERPWRVLTNRVLLKVRAYMQAHGIESNGPLGLYAGPDGALES